MFRNTHILPDMLPWKCKDWAIDWSNPQCRSAVPAHAFHAQTASSSSRFYRTSLRPGIFPFQKQKKKKTNKKKLGLLLFFLRFSLKHLTRRYTLQSSRRVSCLVAFLASGSRVYLLRWIPERAAEETLNAVSFKPRGQAQSERMRIGFVSPD